MQVLTAMTREQAAAVRKHNHRKYTAPPKLLSGSALFHGISPSWPYECAARLCVPVRLVSEANAREHHQVKAKRVKLQRSVTALWLSKLGAADWRTDVKRVRIVRLAPRQLDSDNLAGSAKAIRDQVAAWLSGQTSILGRGDDGPTSGIEWAVDQEKCGHYGVRIELYP